MSEPILANLRELHDAILANLRDTYRDRVYTIAAYDPFPELDGQDPKPVDTPAILLEIEDIEPGEMDGTDRTPLHLSFVAHCILSFRTTDLQLELREFGADMLAHVRDNRWGLRDSVRQPTALSAKPGEFRPDLDGFDSMLVRWEHEVYVGENFWDGGKLPTEVYVQSLPFGVERGGDQYDQVYP